MKRRLALLSLVFCAPSTGQAQPSDLAVELFCRREPSPGRVVCDLDIEPRRGRLVWGDALIQKAPEFTRPLRSRVGVREAGSNGGRRFTLPLAFVATSTGKGEVDVWVRAVLCNGELCAPQTRRVKGTIEVGLEEPAPG